MATRVSADKKYVEELAKGKIRESNLLYFKNGENDGASGRSQTALYLYALSLGVNKGVRTPSKVREGMILNQSFYNTDLAKAFVYSVALQEFRKEHREGDIEDEDKVFLVAEEYANTGFEIIESMLGELQDSDEETIELDLMDQLDQKYRELMPEE